MRYLPNTLLTCLTVACFALFLAFGSQAQEAPEAPEAPEGAEQLCSDECPSANDGECDDGGEGSLFDLCPLGTDCADCGPRQAP